MARTKLENVEHDDAETAIADRAIQRAAKLRELASKRVPAAVKQIRLVGNLLNYKPTEEQTIRIVETLQAAVDDVRHRFNGKRSTDVSFDLEDAPA